ncbi:MAG: ECF transporter S component [Oscillospiraceae bacterium]|jgi:uncharacterized membrane protein|nr:ECF transporter S component [Oscillospiraceae bacterium]
MASKKTLTQHQKIFHLTAFSMLSALIIVLTATPVGYITTPLFAVTIIHLPVLVGAIVFGAPDGAALGAVWGITCIIKAVVAPPTPLEGIIFRNPLVALVPRVLAGLVAGLIAGAFRRFGEKGALRALGAGLSAAGGAVVNSALVLSSLYLLYNTQLDLGGIQIGGWGKYITAAAGLNAPIEIAAAVVLLVPVSEALRQALKRMQ